MNAGRERRYADLDVGLAELSVLAAAKSGARRLRAPRR
jgi:hypothetical protein